MNSTYYKNQSIYFNFQSMKKLSKLFLMGAVVLGLGLTACNNEDVNGPVDESKANTHISIALKLGRGSSLRSLPTDYNYVGTWAGNDAITSITVFVSDATEVTYKRYDVGENEAYKMVGDVVTPNTTAAAIKTTPGWKEVYVLVNAKSKAEEYLGTTGGSGTIAAGTFKTKYADILALGNSFYDGTAFKVETSASKLAEVNTDKLDDIMMTNVTPQTITVAPNVKDTETIDPEKKLNRVSLEVERAVARVMVTTKQDAYNVPSADGSSTIGTLTDITWVLAQGENSLFVQRKANWETPNHTWVPTTATYLQAAEKYDYSGLYESYNATTQFGGTTVPKLAAYTALNAEGSNKAEVLASLGLEAKDVNGKFVLPTTHEVAKGENSGFKKGNTAYVMVRAKFTPTTFAGTGDFDEDDVPGTFYLGANGKFYKNATDAVIKDNGGVPDQKVAKYVGGKVIYYAWVNPDVIPDWYNSPVLRNNIYHIHITGFKTIGTNWNPLFPEDPNTPKTPDQGGNPDPKPSVPNVNEPESPIDPTDPLTTPETWMSVDVTVLPWLVHSYDVDLGI